MEQHALLFQKQQQLQMQQASNNQSPTLNNNFNNIHSNNHNYRKSNDRTKENDRVYNETDNDSEKDKVLNNIERMKNKAVQALTIGKSTVDNTMTKYNNKIANHNSKSTNNSYTILDNDNQIVKYSNKSKNTNENTSQTMEIIRKTNHYFHQQQTKQIPRSHSSKTVECNYNTNNVVKNMKEKLNNSSNNIQHSYGNIVRVKVTSKAHKTNILEDGVYNEIDNECEEDEVLTRIGWMENNAV